MFKIGDRIVTFLPPQDIEPEALQQIKNTASVPFLYRHVAVMPDTHYGKGSTVGTVLAKGAVIPAAVGVDIGCGMIAVKTTLQAGDLAGKLPAIRSGIERRIPMSAGKVNKKITETARARIGTLEEDQPGNVSLYDQLSPSWRVQLGTLGGGNHFIEVCLDTDQNGWGTVHSGSRGIGNKIGTRYISKAQDRMKQEGINLPDRDLAYLTEDTKDFADYLRDLRWAQRFALLNREEMLDRVMAEIAATVRGDWTRCRDLEYDRINTHHNFTQTEEHFGERVWVTRKGAIQAKKGMKSMIPGSMGTRSYIVSGLENEMAFHSAPHGAGRKMSRAKARQSFTMADFDRVMAGIEHRRSRVLLDEIPSAYKDIDEVMANAKELVKVEAVLKQVLNVKGD